MMTVRELAARAGSKLEEWRHRRVIARVLGTPPLPVSESGTLVFSQLCAKDLPLYLLAAKTFARHTGLRRFAVLDDGSLSPADHSTLQHHLPGLRIIPISAVAPRSTPARGCWERLLMLVELARDEYVIQLDADTLTLAPLKQLVAAVHSGRAFALTDEPDARVRPIAEAVTWAREYGDPHVQIAAESALDQLDPALVSHYLRGCAALTGLPPAERLAAVERISATMWGALGARWPEWGTEQVAVNLLTANAPGVVLLRQPDYATHEGMPLPQGARFVHFIGWARFSSNVYRRCAYAAIQELLRAG